jgi:hypothetical protein
MVFPDGINGVRAMRKPGSGGQIRMTSADQAQDDIAAQVAWLHLDWVVAGDGERAGLGTERHAVDVKSKVHGPPTVPRSWVGVPGPNWRTPSAWPVSLASVRSAPSVTSP